MINKVSNFLYKKNLTPIVIAFLIIISYGLFIPFMGYFMDDWYIIWFKHLFGALQFPNYFSVDRPLMGYFYVAANFILGNSESPIVWQLFGLFTRWLCVYALWGFLTTLWPDSKRQNTLVVLLAAVFPGFTQQWIAVIYCFFFTCLAGFFFSLTLMLKAIRTPKRFWFYIILSFVVGVYSYAAAEFYFGLELIRPVILWIEYSRGESKYKLRFWKTLKTEFPFLIAFIIYGIWRAFFFTSVNHEVMISNNIQQSPLTAVVELVRKTYQAGVDGVVNAWFNPLNLGNYPDEGKVPLLLLGVVIIVFGILIFWLFSIMKHEQPSQNTQDKNWTHEAFWVAFISLIVAILPFWAADLPVDYLYPFDRFLLAYLLGSCLLLVVLFDNKKIGLVVIALLVAVSTGYQINLGIRYKNYWAQQSDFFWQLTWRAPGIKADTALVTEDLPFSDYFSATSLTAPLNIIYASDLKTHDIPYVFILFTQQASTIPSIAADQPINYDFRSFEFTGNTSEILLFKKSGDGCLRIITPDQSSLEFFNSDRHSFWHSAIPLSNPDRIIPDPEIPTIPPEKYFGTENQNQWCYYFEKADLARQQKDWQQTIQLYEKAQVAGFKPIVDVEWIPLVDAYLNTNEIEKAMEITRKIEDHEQTNTAGFCQLWTNAKEDDNVVPFAEEILSWLNCRE